MTNYAGIDTGSRMIELVVITEGQTIVQKHLTNTGFEPISNVGSLLSKAKYDFITATGYGQNSWRFY